LDEGRTGHWSDESVAAAGQRLDEPRHIGRVPERIAQPANRGIQAVLEIDERVFPPEALSQLLTGDQVAGMIQQRLENLKRLVGEIDPDTGLPQLARAQVQLERAKADERIRWSAHGDFGSPTLNGGPLHATTPGNLAPYLYDRSKLARSPP
jgi:hypothetical protein